MERIHRLAGHLQPSGTMASAPSAAKAGVLYVANRGIVALRVTRTAKRLGFRVVGGYCPSDAKELFVKAFDEAAVLEPAPDGLSVYAHIDGVIRAAKKLGASAVHPGIGFLSESGDFARACEAAGLTFIGPDPDALDLFGNKFKTCLLAKEQRVPTLNLGLVPKTGELTEEQKAIVPVLLKATNGGGGLGLRLVTSAESSREVYQRCLSEAKRAFASDRDTDICAERYLTKARHVEVQIVGDGTSVIALGDRECTVQRKFQKVIEVAPCPALDENVRKALVESAERIARAIKYKGVGTFEFLVRDKEFFFIECNPRLQVEHTVTEQVFPGLDLVACQLRILALRESVSSVLSSIQRSPVGSAIQVRICAETYSEQGQTLPVPATARIRSLDLPRGSYRIETSARSGYVPNPRFDSLLAQFICFDSSFEQCSARMREALAEFKIKGCPTNLNLVRAIFEHPKFLQNQVTTTFLDEEFPLLRKQMLVFDKSDEAIIDEEPVIASKSQGENIEPETLRSDNTLLISSPMQALVVSVMVEPGSSVEGNRTVLVVLSALKMEHEIRCSRSGQVGNVFVKPGDNVEAGAELCEIQVTEGGALASGGSSRAETYDAMESPVFKTFFEKVKYSTEDESRPKKTAGRLKEKGRLSARQMLARFFDRQDIELGRLANNGYQEHSVGDGLYVVQGLANGKQMGVKRPEAVCLAYDYTVLAGTQGLIGHKKKDRIFDLLLTSRLPTVLFAEGGGGRAGDAKAGGFTASGLDGPAFTLFAKLAAQGVPLVGAVSGFCFAGNAALLGTCDVIVAAKNASIGMGGPAMIEGGGLGIVRPEEVGPVEVHFKLGVVDVLVDDDATLVDTSRKVLGYFQGPSATWQEPPGTSEERAKTLRNLVPTTNRRLAFDVRVAINNIFDGGSITELKSAFAKNLITCFARIEGRPVGVMANDCRFVSGTLDANASRKAADFINLCSKHRLPLVVLCDTPGFLVGVESEKEGLVKRAGEMFIAGANKTVPVFVVVIRRCVGLGGQAMCCGDLKVPALTVSWPTGEFGAMGFEGAVRLGFREEIKNDPSLFEKLVNSAYENGKALMAAGRFEIDDVVDPADTRMILKNAIRYSRFE